MSTERVQTTFWQDFTIADHFGVAAIEDTYQRAFTEWRTDYRYLTELVMVLNHKIWQHCEAGNEPFAKVYDKLWCEANNWAYDNLEGEELAFYWRVLD